jgi:hypothetical protein
MSDLRIALVAEGPLDRIVIEAALRAILPTAFVLTVLQPEATRPHMGTGWGGVLKWCHASGLRHRGPLDLDPTLAGFDMLIIHLDADVADKQYGDCGPEVAIMAQQKGWHVLPCSQPCPPAAHTCEQLKAAIASWLDNVIQGQKTVLCIPAQSTGTWLAAAVLGSEHPLLGNAECNPELERQLALLPLKQRIKKSQRDYRLLEEAVTDQWQNVTRLCSQALVFDEAIQRVGDRKK